MQKTLFLLIILILSQHLFGQWPIKKDYKMAPEIWSEPVAIPEFTDPYKIYEHPTLNSSLDTMYLPGIRRSVLVNGKWTEPEFIPQLHHGGAYTSHPSLSRDGKRLYHTAWGGYGSWDMYVSNWNDTLKTWGTPINLGPEINTGAMEWYAYEVSEDTLYVTCQVVTDMGKVRYVKDSLTNKWTIDEDYYYTEYGALSGLSVTTDRKKMYFSQWRSTWEDYYKKGTELCVTYWDSTKNDWGENYFLNINSEAYPLDSTDHPNTLGGWDGNPWISADGKVLFFSSSKNVNWEDSQNTHDIFVSYLLVDENGDTVTTVSGNSPNNFNFTLSQNYPNPFNPSTKINYTLNKEDFVRLTIYDSIGRRVAEPISERKTKGTYNFTFYSENYGLSSGVYYYQLFLGGHYKVKKMLLTK